MIRKKIRTYYQKQFIRFLFVSGINTIFGYGLFVLLIYFGMHYSLAILIGTILGVLFNFKTIGAIVFREKNNTLIFRFFGVYGVIYLGNISGLKLFTLMGISNYIGGAAMLVPMGLLSYLLNKHFVFNKNFDKQAITNKL